MAPHLPLNGLRVIDASDHVGGQFCARMLADQGARVVLVEPPTGSPVRRMGPFLHDAPHLEASLLFWHLNSGKRSVTLDAKTASGLAVFRQLCLSSDVVIVSDQDLARQLDPDGRQVICAVSDFGWDGPYAHWLGSELIHQALSGVMYTTGHPAKAPIYGVGNRAYYACGVTAYCTVLAALLDRERSGLGQVVEASVMESCAAMAQNLVTFASYSGTSLTRRAYPGMMGMFQCRDGWVVLFALQNWPGICEAFGIEEFAADERFLSYAGRTANWPAAMELLSAASIGLSVEDVVRIGQANRVTVSRVATVAELRDSPHLAARAFWRSTTDASGRCRALLGPMFRPSAWPETTAAAAPALGAGNSCRLADAGVSTPELDALRRSGTC
jgi:crotonobetainyl-CoA:carnitine CoA-transferase CaiB-like acyl-CoA transferase